MSFCQNDVTRPTTARKAPRLLVLLLAATAMASFPAPFAAAAPEQYRTLPGAMRETTCAAFSPDGKWLAAAGKGLRSGEVKLFDLETGEEKLQLQIARAPLTLAFSPDGTRLAAAYPSSAARHALKVWELDGENEGYELDSLYGPRTWGFRSDGTQIATWNADRTITIWDAASADEIFSFEPKGWKRELNTLRWRPQSQEIAAAEPSNPGWIHFWSAEDGKPLRKIKTGEAGASSFEFSGDGRTLVADAYLEGIKVWDAETGRPRAKTPYWRVRVSYPLAVSPNGKLIAMHGASVNYDKAGPIRVWSGDSGKELFEIKDRAPKSIVFSPDSSLLAGVLGEDGVMLWRVAPPDPMFRGPASRPLAATDKAVSKNAPTAPPASKPSDPAPPTSKPSAPEKTLPATASIVPQPLVLKAHPDPEPGEYAHEKRAIVDLALSPDHSKLASVHGAGEVNLWDLTTGERTPLASGGGSRHVRFTADGALLLAGNCTQVSAWDVASTAGKASFGDGTGSESDWYVAPDGLALATLDYPGDGVRRIRFWSVAAPETPLLTVDVEENIKCLAISRGGALAALQFEDSKDPVRLFDLKAKTEIAPIQGLPYRAAALAFHPNGKVLAIVCGSELQFWDVSKSPARLVAKQESGWSYSESLFFSDDGRYLVLPGREVQLWRVASRTLQAPIAGLREHVAVSADGTTIVGLTEDYTSVVADCATGQIRTALEVALPLGEPASKWGASGAYAVSKDGGFVAIGAKSGSIEVRPLVADTGASEAVVFQLKAPEMRDADGQGTNLPQIGFSADGKYVVHRRDEWTAIGERASGKIWYPRVPPEPRLPPKALQLAGYYFHPTNRILFALAGGQNSLWRYDIDSGNVIADATTRRQYHALEISPDQKLVAAVVTPPAKPLQVVLMNPENGRPLGEPLVADASDQLGNPSSAQFAFSSDSRRLAVLLGREIRVWDVANRKEFLLNTKGDWHSIYLIENGTVLAAVDRNRDQLKLFDLDSTQLKGEIQLKRYHTGGIHDVAVSPTDPLFATVGDNGEVLVRELASGDLLARFSGHQGTVDSVAFSPDGKTLATAEVANVARRRPETGTIRLWTIDLDALAKDKPASTESAAPSGAGDNSRPAASTLQPPREIASMAIDMGLAAGTSDSQAMIECSPDARYLAVGIGNYGSPTFLIDLAEQKQLWTSEEIQGIRWVSEQFRPYQFAADGRSILSATGNGTGLFISDLSSGKTEKSHDRWTTARFAFSPDGKTIAFGGSPYDKQAPVFMLLDRKTLQERGPHIELPGGAATAIAYSPDGALLAVGIWDGKAARVQLLDPTTLEVKGTLADQPTTAQIDQILFAPDGKSLCLRHSNASEIWSVSEPKLLRSTSSSPAEGYTPLAFIGSSGLLAMQDGNHYIVYDVATNKPRIQFEATSPADITPDGRILATRSKEGIVVWDVLRGTPLPSPAVHEDEVLDAALSDDGRTLITVAIDNTIKVWSLDGRTE